MSNYTEFLKQFIQFLNQLLVNFTITNKQQVTLNYTKPLSRKT